MKMCTSSCAFGIRIGFQRSPINLTIEIPPSLWKIDFFNNKNNMACSYWCAGKKESILKRCPWNGINTGIVCIVFVHFLPFFIYFTPNNCLPKINSTYESCQKCWVRDRAKKWECGASSEMDIEVICNN